VTIVDRLYAPWNRHDVDGVLAFFAPDARYHDQALGVTFEGRDALAAFVAATFVAIPNLRFEVVSSFEAPGHAAAELVMRGYQSEDLPGLPVTGEPFAVHYALIADVVDDRITRLVDYWNRIEYAGGEVTAPPRARAA
jgi:steroid delta-isomerase-like uncharacterized protein